MRRRFGLLAVVVLPVTLLFGGRRAVPDDAAPPPRPLSLREALERGLLEARGEAPGSYLAVDLVLSNRSKEPLLVDLAGHHLRPTTGDVQRLGLSHPVTPTPKAPNPPPGTWPFALAPGATAKVRMATCCLDAGRPCPRPTDRFQLASAATPKPVEAALRWWVDHPDAPQGFVNAAIWQNDVRLLGGSWRREPGSPRGAGPTGRRIRSHGGLLYRLHDGALTSTDTEGVTRFHATWIFDVLPRADALYAIGEREGATELWRFAATGEPPWGKVLALGSARALDLFLPLGDGAFAVRDAQVAAEVRPLRIARATTGAPGDAGLSLGEFDVASATLAEADKDRFVVVARTKGRPKGNEGSLGTAPSTAAAAKHAVFDVDRATGRVAMRKQFWNVRRMVAGPGGVFALSHVGSPERLEGEKLRRIPCETDFEEILLVGRTKLVLRDKQGALVALDVGSGKTSPLPPEAAGPKEDVLSIDPVTDDVVWVGARDDLRWRFGEPTASPIP